MLLRCLMEIAAIYQEQYRQRAQEAFLYLHLHSEYQESLKTMFLMLSIAKEDQSRNREQQIRECGQSS